MLSFEKILLYYAIPYFTISIIVEIIYARWRGGEHPDDRYHFQP